MRNGIKATSAALALAASGLTVGLGSGVAAAGTGATLPITSFHQIVADPASGYLFISQGSSSVNEILVTNLAGQEVGTISGQDGVMGIALSPDGSTLYAALSADHSVTAISTSTLQQTASYPLGDANTPEDIAVQSGKVWVSYSTGTAGAAIGDIDLTAASPAFETQANMGGWASAPQIATDPQDTGVLIAALPGASPDTVASYNVSVDPATLTAEQTVQNCENETDLAVTPGGSEFILACGYPYAFYRYSTADLSEQGSYAGTTYPDAVAIDGSGDVAAGAANGVTTNPDIYVYPQGGDTPLNTFSLNSSGANLAARGLAWAPDGATLFAVMSYYNDIGGTTTYSLQVLQYPTLIQPALVLTGPSTAEITKSVKLTGSLMVSGSAAPAGTAITISRSEAGSTTVKNFTVTTGSNGSFSLTDTPPAVGQYTYTGNYAGTSTIAPASASQTVTVTQIPTSLTVAATPTRATYEPTIRVTAHLGTTYTGRTVSIYAQPFGSSSTKLLKTARVNSHGELTVTYRAAHSTRFRAVFAGDARYAPDTASHVVYVRAKVSESLSGYISTRHIGGRTYRVFQRKKTMRVHVAVAPSKRGECVQFNLELYYQGSWYSDVTGCGSLSKSSTLTIGVKLTKASLGYHYRIQADYLRGSDTSNLGNDSAWAYFMVEK